MSISETTLTRIIDTGERADDMVRQIGRRARAMSESEAAPIARALGWFSIGLGLAEVLAPASMARMTGMQGYEAALRLFGLREMASGIGILAGPGPAASWLWARVAGAVAGVMLADILCAQRLTADSR